MKPEISGALTIWCIRIATEMYATSSNNILGSVQWPFTTFDMWWLLCLGAYDIYIAALLVHNAHIKNAENLSKSIG